MKALVGYELKKAVSPRKAGVIFILAAALCCAIFIFNRQQADYEYVREIQSDFSGRVSEGKVAESVARYKELLEKMNTKGLSEDEEQEFYDLETPVWLNRCDEVRKEKLSALGIQPETLTIGDTISYGFMENFISRYLPLIICSLSAFLIGPVFSSEYETKMDGLLLAAKNGKRKVIFAKFISSAIIVGAVYFGVFLTYMIFAAAVYGFSEGSVSFVFTAGDPFHYLASPFDFTVLQYSVIMISVSLAGTIGYCVFVLFVSSRCRHSAVSTMVSMAVGIVPFLTYVIVNDERSAVTNALRFAYSQIISVRTLFTENSTTALGSKEIQTVYLALAVLCAVTGILAAGAYQTFRRHQAGN